jgi:hypothetical protein
MSILAGLSSHLFQELLAEVQQFLKRKISPVILGASLAHLLALVDVGAKFVPFLLRHSQPAGD